MQVQQLMGRLVDGDRFDLHFIAREADPRFRAEGYALHRLEARRAVSGTLLLDVPALAGLLDRIAPDIVYQRIGGAYTAVAAWWARRRGARMVWHVSSNNDLATTPWRWSLRTPFEVLDRRLMDYGARQASAVIVQNREQALLLARRFDRHDAVHVPNFHPLPAVASPKAPGRVTICWIANIKELKRPEVFVRLAADLRDHPDWEFVMVGAQQMGGRAWEEFQGQVASLPNLTYLGHRSQDEVNSILDRAHLLVNTSAFEGFPNTFIQAWMRAVPVLSLAVNPDGVFDAEELGICAGGDYARLREAVRSLAGDTPRRQETGRRAASLARERYSVANIGRVVDVLQGDCEAVRTLR